MRPKQEILDDLFSHAQKLDPQHYELAAVAMIETEIQIDIRDALVTDFKDALNALIEIRKT